MNDAELQSEVMARRALLVAEQNAIAEKLRGIDAFLKSNFQSREMELPMQTPVAVTSPVNGNGYAKMTAAQVILAAIEASPKHFSLRDVMQFLTAHQPALAKQYRYAGNVFWAVCKERGYSIVRRGAGRAPTVYSKESE